MSYAQCGTQSKTNADIKDDGASLMAAPAPGSPIRLPFIARIVGLSRSFGKGDRAAPGAKADVLAAPARQVLLAVTARRAFGKAGSRPWLANHASDRDVAQTPSNLG